MKTTVDHGATFTPPVQDITPEEAADWVAEEFYSLTDIHAIEARIGVESSIVEANAPRADEFPWTQFAHESLLEELRAEYARQTLQMVSMPRTLH
jgi:hypothetical protein